MESQPPAIDPDAPPPLPEPTQRPWYRRRLAQISAILAAILAYPVTKILIGLVAVSLAGEAARDVYGDAWDSLPDPTRASLEGRLDAAYGDALQGLSETARSDRLEEDVRNGLPRLDDELLVQRLILQTTLLHEIGEADCAAFGRTSLGGSYPAEATVQSFIQAMSTSEFQTFAEITVAAIEAELRDSPEVRTIAPAQEQQAIDAALASLSPTEFQQFVEAVNNASATDAVVCSAIRALYDAALTSGSADLATFALIDISPLAQ